MVLAIGMDSRMRVIAWEATELFNVSRASFACANSFSAIKSRAIRNAAPD